MLVWMDSRAICTLQWITYIQGWMDNNFIPYYNFVLVYIDDTNFFFLDWQALLSFSTILEINKKAWHFSLKEKMVTMEPKIDFLGNHIKYGKVKT